MTPWLTPNRRASTGSTPRSSVPADRAADWRLRIHGMVDRELVLTYQDLIDRRAHRGLDHAQLRVERGRRRPDRQRLVERRARSPTCSAEAGVQAGADAVLQTSEDGWTCGTPLERAHRRPQRDARGRDERPAAADRPRLPGAHDRARALRLRVGVQVGRRPGGHPVRRHRGVLDRARLGRARPGQDRLAHRRARATARSPPARSGRRRRLGAAHRHRGGRDQRRRGRLAAGRARPGARTSTPGCSGRRRVDLEPGDHDACGCAPPTRTASCRPARSRTPRARRRDRAGTPGSFTTPEARTDGRGLRGAHQLPGEPPAAGARRRR